MSEGDDIQVLPETDEEEEEEEATEEEEVTEGEGTEEEETEEDEEISQEEEELSQKESLSPRKNIPELSVDLGWGLHFNSEKPRIFMLQIYRNWKGKPFIKLMMNRDDDGEDTKMDCIVMNPAQWLRVMASDSVFRPHIEAVKENGTKLINSDLYRNLGYGCYEFVQSSASRKIQIKKKFLPLHHLSGVDWSKKKNCDEVYDYLFNTHQGVSLNAYEYLRMSEYFKQEIIEKYIPEIGEYSVTCKCLQMPPDRQKRCQFCRYFTFNLEK